MDDQTGDALDAVARDPDDLDGHTIEELADYLDAGREPLDPSIESSAACRNALAALEHLRTVAADLLTNDPADSEDEDGWITRVMSGIALDAHAGADFPLAATAADTRLLMTEGALRAVVRTAGDDEPGFLVGRVRFQGDLDSPDLPLTIDARVTVRHGTVIPVAVERLRDRIRAAVQRHTGFQQVTIDITVEDVEGPARAGGAA